MERQTHLLVRMLVLIALGTISLSVQSVSGQSETPPPPDKKWLGEKTLEYFDPDQRMERHANQPPSETTMASWAYAVFQRYDYYLENWDIYTFKDGYQTRLTYSSAVDRYPDLADFGTKLAFDSNRDGDYEIFSLNFDGSNLFQVTHNSVTDTAADWAPGGNKLAFTSQRNGNWDIYTINVDGTQEAQLTSDAADDALPSWSPDGSKIAWARLGGGNSSIWVMNADGSDAYAVTPYCNYLAMGKIDWSFDGSKIAFDCDYDGDGWNELVTTTLSGSMQMLYDSENTNIEAWLGAYAIGSQDMYFTKATYTLYGGQYYLIATNLYDGPIYNGEIHDEMRLTFDNYDMHPDFVQTDLEPPYIYIAPFPEFMRIGINQIPVEIYDIGESGWASYWFQYHIEGDDTWRDVCSPPCLTPWVTLNTPYGIKTYFRYRAKDGAGNMTDWGPILHTTLFHFIIDGQARENRGNLIPKIPIQFNPDAANDSTASLYGDYIAYLVHEVDGYIITTDVPGYTNLETNVIRTEYDRTIDVWEMPTDNIIQNGSFEDGLTGWYTNTAVGLWDDAERHGGQLVAGLGNDCFLPVCASASEVVPTGEAFYAGASVIDSQDNLHLFENHLGLNNNEIYYLVKTQEGTWSDPVMIFSFPGSELAGQELVKDIHDNLFAVWEIRDYSAGFLLYFAYKPAGSNVWSEPELLGDGGGVHVAADSLGNAHIVYGEQAFTGAYYRRRLSTGIWDAPVQFAGSTPNITVSLDDTVHLVWRPEPYPTSGVYQSRDAQGVWGPMEDIPMPFSYFPEVAVDLAGNVHVINNSHYIMRSADTGVWSTKEFIGDYYGQSQLVGDMEGNLLFTYSDGFGVRQIYKPLGGPWSESQPFHPGSPVSVIIDPHNRFHFFFDDSSSPYDTGFLHLWEPAGYDEQDAWIAQTVTVPDILHQPTLGIFYKLYASETITDSNLFVYVMDGITKTLVTPNITNISSGWDYLWVDMDQWANQSVVISTTLHQAAGEAPVSLLLDDINLGSWLFPAVFSIDPEVILTGWEGQLITVHGDNFDPGATITMNGSPITDAVIVDPQTIQFAIQAGISPGIYWIQVENPGGYKSAGKLILGHLIFLPVLQKSW